MYLRLLHCDSLAQRQLFRISASLSGGGWLPPSLFHCLHNWKMNGTISDTDFKGCLYLLEKSARVLYQWQCFYFFAGGNSSCDIPFSLETKLCVGNVGGYKKSSKYIYIYIYIYIYSRQLHSSKCLRWSFFIGRIFELNFVIVPRSCLFHTFFSHVSRSCLFPRRWYCVKSATPSSMPGDGTGFGISNWILNKYYCNETGKVPVVCEIQVSALPQNITDMIWNLQPRHQSFTMPVYIIPIEVRVLQQLFLCAWRGAEFLKLRKSLTFAPRQRKKAGFLSLDPRSKKKKVLSHSSAIW